METEYNLIPEQQNHHKQSMTETEIQMIRTSQGNNISNDRKFLMGLKSKTYEEQYPMLHCLYLNRNTDLTDDIYTCECVGNNITSICSVCINTCHNGPTCNRLLTKKVYIEIKDSDDEFDDNDFEDKEKRRKNHIENAKEKNITCMCGKYNHLLPLAIPLPKTDDCLFKEILNHCIPNHFYEYDEERFKAITTEKRNSRSNI